MQNETDVINSFDEIAKTTKINTKTQGWAATNHYYKKSLDLCLTNNANILDIGCGQGDFIRLATKSGFSCTGIDFSPEMIKKAESVNADTSNKCKFICGNAYDILLNMPENSFDVAYSFAAMHHMDYTKIVPLLSKCIKKDGIFVVVDLYDNNSSFIDLLMKAAGFIPARLKSLKNNKITNSDIDLKTSQRNHKAWEDHWSKLDIGLGLIVPLKEIKKRIKSTGYEFEVKRLLYFRYMAIIHF